MAAFRDRCAGRFNSLPRSSTEAVLNRLDIPQPIPSQSCADSVRNFEEQLFACKSEITALRSQNTLLRSQLYSIEKEVVQFWGDLFDSARKWSFFKREATALAMKIQFLEQLLNATVDLGLLDRDILEGLARELEREMEEGHMEEEDMSQSKASATCDDPNGSSPSLSQSTNIRPYIPSFLKPITAVNETVESNVNKCPSPGGLTAHQMQALLSFERLIATFSTDLGSLETLSEDSLSSYSHESSDTPALPSSVPAHVQDADATLVVEQVTQSQLCKCSSSNLEITVPSDNSKPRVPVNTSLKHIHKSTPSLRVPHSVSDSSSKLPKLSCPSGSTKPRIIVQVKDRTPVTRQNLPSQTRSKAITTRPHLPNSKRPQRPQSPFSVRNTKPLRRTTQTNRVSITAKLQSKKASPVTAKRKENMPL
ncbi:hypothetical protein L218DRAFT_1074977 [Marasmius fiardii PR-910]|nr:hypothetical protein L218DRAFT_1074977 [Marasmius fiardii PR-910]